MKATYVHGAVLFLWLCRTVAADPGYLESEFGAQVPASTERVRLWWASSGWKVGRDRAAPAARGTALQLSAARAEAEAVQLVIRPVRDLNNVAIRATDLTGPQGSVLPAGHKGEKHPWGNGDGRFIYPPAPAAAAQARAAAPILEGPVDSVRWEMLRDGIEDYEYFAMLRRLLERRRGDLSAEQVRRYSALLAVPAAVTTDLTHFTLDPAPLETHRHRVARALAELTPH